MASDKNDAAIVRSTIHLAHNLGLRVVAEGVENQEVWDMLVDLGCDLAQGYFLSRPVPAEDLIIWLKHPFLVRGKPILEVEFNPRLENIN